MKFIQIFLTAFHVIFQHGENYMISLVRIGLFKKTIPPISPSQRSRVEWFCAQEKTHSVAHENLWRNEAPPTDLEFFSEFCSHFGHLLIRTLPFTLNLAIASAIEHLTATFAELVLREDLFQQSNIDPKTLNVLKWHCREEIEHRDVVFDVMKHFSKGGLLLRFMGLVGAVSVLSFLGVIGTFTLLKKRKLLFSTSTLRESLSLFIFKEGLAVRTVLPALVFLKPHYHPSQLPLDDLVKPRNAPKIIKNEKHELSEVILAVVLFTSSITLAYEISLQNFTAPFLFGAILIQCFLIMQLVLQFHDCLHGALFNKSDRHIWMGRTIGAYCLWPFHYLRESHLSHHRNVGRLDKDTEILHFTAEMTRNSRFLKTLNFLARTPLGPLLFTPLLQGHHFTKWLRNNLSQLDKPLYRKKLREYALDCLLMLGFWTILYAFRENNVQFARLILIGYLAPSLCAMAAIYIFAKPLHTQMFSVTDGSLPHPVRVFSVSRSFESNPVVRLAICNLNYHIEHHLHPTANRWRLRQISVAERAQNEAFARSENLPYAFHQSYRAWYEKIHSDAPATNQIRNIEDWKKANPAC